MNTDSDENDMKRAAKLTIEKYFFQLTEGCGKQNCSNINCASNINFKKLDHNQAAVVAIRLAREKAELCETSTKSAKQFKSSANSEPENNMNLDKTNSNTNNASSPRTSNSLNNNQMEDDDDFLGYSNNDDNDVVVSGNSSVMNLRAGSAQSTTKTSDLKSLDDALKDAVNYVSKMNEISKSSAEATSSKRYPYLSEDKILNLIKKCKKVSSESMEVDNQLNKNEQASNYTPLISLVQKVFQSYKYLSVSFTFKNDQTTAESTETTSKTMSTTMPTIPPFKIDFNSLRRSYSLLFGLANDQVQHDLEEAIDYSVKTLCFSIRMIIKKSDINENEINQIVHSLLIVNELPMLEDPKYMDRCAKTFYATISELPLQACANIIQLWSHWQADELKIFLNRIQQYITVCVISKNLDEDSNRNQNENEDDELGENEKNCLHKHEGISGAVAFLRLIYYASIMGGRLDSPDQIKREREIESEEMKLIESETASEESSMFADNSNFLNKRLDPLEDLLNVRPIDCREPKIPFDQFLNDVANKYIDIQHDYVEYVQYIQNLEQRSYQFTKTNKKQIFSFLANPFFLVLSRKNLGLYYDNKIKMMRERRNNIMMSILEGMMPNPYFKMRLTRNNLLVEALSLIELQEQENPSILRKQLFIEFENEQGIDQGGVSKEFFQLAIDELLNRGYTFFKYDENTRYYWFTPCTLETEKEFKLIGILFGIAIYNSVLLDVQFPPIFFRKLMGKIGTFEDLQYSHPQLYSTLTALLEFNGSDEEFEETFMITFQISLNDNFDSVVSFNLKENGDKISVTKANRREFVDLYADFILNKGIEESFNAFKRGFMKMVVHSPLYQWYLPEELEILLCGSNVLDWESLENSTTYDSGFESDQQYIKEFWEVFRDFTVEEKRLFLKFTTGTDRCPHGGLSELKLTIARNGPDTEKLPTAHTCFNVLLLPEYSNKQKLKEKLIKAIQYSRGFGLS